MIEKINKTKSGSLKLNQLTTQSNQEKKKHKISIAEMNEDSLLNPGTYK